MKKVIVVVGPTGVGKTKLGVELARKYNGEVISGDSMQIYKTMDIGTAKVTKEETKGIVHHLIDVKSPLESYSVQEFQKVVREKIDDIVSRGKIPIIVGGTGLYIKAVLYDYTFKESEVDPKIIQNKYKDYTNEELHNYLKEIDEKAALSIHFNNRRRVLRAIEIYETTGTTKSETEEKQKHEMIYDAYIIGLTIDRELLYKRINDRVDMMINNGLENEIHMLKNKGLSLDYQSMKAIGYKEWFIYDNKDEIIEAIKKNSRNYAKRQYTWFKNQMNVHWYNVNLNNFNETLLNIEGDIDGQFS